MTGPESDQRLIIGKRGCRRMLVVLVVCLGSVAVCCIGILTNSARRPLQDIEAEALSITPLGSSITEVQAAVKKHYGVEVSPRHRDYEEKYYCITLDYGSFIDLRNFPLIGTTTRINWYFDDNHRLGSVHAYHYVDGP
jgi:hypothetical protein